jgi:hypothetical protein
MSLGNFYNPFLTSTPPPQPGRTLLTGFPPPRKRKVFVSYHHGGDQAYYNAFSRHFSATYDVIQDNSLRDSINSDNVEYIMRKIREDYITGSSCTFVLCGKESRWRKYIDWEIKATLDANHGLIGVLLPTNPVSNNACHKPDRFQDNLDSGYATWLTWSTIIENTSGLPQLIEAATGKDKQLIRNQRQMMSRNGTPPWLT